MSMTSEVVDNLENCVSVPAVLVLLNTESSCSVNVDLNQSVSIDANDMNSSVKMLNVSIEDESTEFDWSDLQIVDEDDNEDVVAAQNKQNKNIKHSDKKRTHAHYVHSDSSKSLKANHNRREHSHSYHHHHHHRNSYGSSRQMSHSSHQKIVSHNDSRRVPLKSSDSHQRLNQHHRSNHSDIKKTESSSRIIPSKSDNLSKRKSEAETKTKTEALPTKPKAESLKNSTSAVLNGNTLDEKRNVSVLQSQQQKQNAVETVCKDKEHAIVSVGSKENKSVSKVNLDANQHLKPKRSGSLPEIIDILDNSHMAKFHSDISSPPGSEEQSLENIETSSQQKQSAKEYTEKLGKMKPYVGEKHFSPVSDEISDASELGDKTLCETIYESKAGDKIILPSFEASDSINVDWSQSVDVNNVKINLLNADAKIESVEKIDWSDLQIVDEENNKDVAIQKKQNLSSLISKHSEKRSTQSHRAHNNSSKSSKNNNTRRGMEHSHHHHHLHRNSSSSSRQTSHSSHQKLVSCDDHRRVPPKSSDYYHRLKQHHRSNHSDVKKTESSHRSIPSTKSDNLSKSKSAAETKARAEVLPTKPKAEPLKKATSAVLSGNAMDGKRSLSVLQSQQQKQNAVVPVFEDEQQSQVTIGSKENKSIDSKVNKDTNQQLKPKRSSPLPEINDYANSLMQLNSDFDPKQHTCFYCNPCQVLLTTTPSWEDHYQTNNHKQNEMRWRECLELGKEVTSIEPSARQGFIDNAKAIITGADEIVEICSSETGEAESWVCILCAAVCQNCDLLLSHLSSIGHLDNHLAKFHSDIYSPPGNEEPSAENVETLSKERQQLIMQAAKEYMEKHGRGKMKVYVGEKHFLTDADEISETSELVDKILMDQMDAVFDSNTDYKVTCKRISSSKSVGNSDYDNAMQQNSSNLSIGLQHVLELWAPNRRSVPFFYCILCDCLITNCLDHCNQIKHCIAYFLKEYKSVYNCVLRESSSKDEFCKALILAKDKVLELEGHSAKITFVYQINIDKSDVFVAVNSSIAKKIVEEEKLVVPAPPRIKKGDKSTNAATSQKKPTVVPRSTSKKMTASKEKSVSASKSRPQQSTGTNKHQIESKRVHSERKPSDKKMKGDVKTTAVAERLKPKIQLATAQSKDTTAHRRSDELMKIEPRRTTSSLPKEPSLPLAKEVQKSFKENEITRKAVYPKSTASKAAAAVLSKYKPTNTGKVLNPSKSHSSGQHRSVSDKKTSTNYRERPTRPILSSAIRRTGGHYNADVGGNEERYQTHYRHRHHASTRSGDAFGPLLDHEPVLRMRSSVAKVPALPQITGSGNEPFRAAALAHKTGYPPFEPIRHPPLASNNANDSLLTELQLEALRAALESVGVSLGRSLTNQDMVMLRLRLGESLISQLCSQVIQATAAQHYSANAPSLSIEERGGMPSGRQVAERRHKNDSRDRLLDGGVSGRDRRLQEPEIKRPRREHAVASAIGSRIGAAIDHSKPMHRQQVAPSVGMRSTAAPMMFTDPARSGMAASGQHRHQRPGAIPKMPAVSSAAVPPPLRMQHQVPLPTSLFGLVQNMSSAAPMLTNTPAMSIPPQHSAVAAAAGAMNPNMLMNLGQAFQQQAAAAMLSQAGGANATAAGLPHFAELNPTLAFNMPNRAMQSALPPAAGFWAPPATPNSGLRRW